METRGLIRRIAKADFADVVGVALRGDTIAAALVRKRVNAVRVVAIASQRLEGPAESRAAAAASFLREWCARIEADPSRVAIVLDRSTTLLSSMTLPAAAAGNVREVVGFELDRLLPVPSDSLHWACQGRPLGSVGERVAVTVVAAPKLAVEEAAAIVTEAGLPVSAVTTEPVALADYLGFVGVALAATATRAGGRDFFTLVADGRVVASHHLASSKTVMDSALRQVESMLPDRFGDAPRCLGARIGEAGLDPLAAVAGTDFFPIDAEVGEVEVIATGAALAQVGETLGDMNLLPAAMVQTATGFGLRELALSGGVAAMALVLVASIMAKDLSVRAALAAEVDRLEPLVEQTLRRQQKNDEALAQLQRLEQKSRSRVLGYMRAATDLVPATAYLTTFRFREDRIEVDGIANKASDLIAILEASPLFEGVDFTAPTTKYLADQERFSLRMRLQR